MSFDITPPQRNLSNVQASQGSCPGGGGNTGYFRRDKKEDEEEVTYTKDIPEDTFQKYDDLFPTEETEGFFSILGKFFKSIFNKIKNIFSKK